MMPRNPHIECNPIPVDVVFHPSWWHAHAGICFDEEFFYHPVRRVEEERKMEKILYERFGEFGLGKDHDKELPQIGPVHLAAGYIIQEMLGCRVEYTENAPPQVIPAGMDRLDVDPERAFRSPAFKKVQKLSEELTSRYGYVTGDINWTGVLNAALDLVGQQVFTDMLMDPEEIRIQFRQIAAVMERFAEWIYTLTGSTSISVNRNVRHIKQPVFLHSECSHTMISTEQYEEFLLPVDLEWSSRHRPFGIHYCGPDPHRYAEVFGRIPNLDFLDAGWGGDIALLRKHLPNTFLNIRLDPVTIGSWSEEQLLHEITTRVKASGNPCLTGLCCINMDDRVPDSIVRKVLQVGDMELFSYIGSCM